MGLLNLDCTHHVRSVSADLGNVHACGELGERKRSAHIIDSHELVALGAENFDCHGGAGNVQGVARERYVEVQVCLHEDGGVVVALILIVVAAIILVVVSVLVIIAAVLIVIALVFVAVGAAVVSFIIPAVGGTLGVAGGVGRKVALHQVARGRVLE